MKKLKLTELNRLTVDQYKQIDKVPLVVILDNIRSAMNVGSIFRTSDALAIQKIFLCGISATPPNREITKTAIGATDAVDWEYCKTTIEAIETLKNKGYHIYAIEQTSTAVDLEKLTQLPPKIAIIMGNEVQGVDANILPYVDGAIEIAQYGTKHSLNVSVCAGIVIYQLANKLKKM
ncbi:MAG: RNA methyltransferase [Saprospiraceae bacterium]